MTRKSQALDELLPCPFCGQSRVYLNAPSTTFPRGSINCPACMVVMPGEVGEAELIETWNRRALGGTPAKQGENIAEELFRPIIGIENRTAREVFDIMSDRFQRAASSLHAANEELRDTNKRQATSIGEWAALAQKNASDAVLWQGRAEAALSRHPVAVAVKPLEWRDRHRPTTRLNDLIADSSVGEYAIRPSASGSRFRLWVPGSVQDDMPIFETLEAAKTAAQSHFATLIRSALTASPVPAKADGGVTEAMVDAFKAKYREFWPSAWPDNALMAKEFDQVLLAAIAAALKQDQRS